MRAAGRSTFAKNNPRRKAARFFVNLAAKQWCDLWHEHFDWDGAGNGGWRVRRSYLSALLIALTRARRELAAGGGVYQIFATVHPKSSADDALYVHTPNPNGTPFPAEYGEARRLTSLPPLLAGRVPLERYAVFAVGQDDDRYFVVEPLNDPTMHSNGPPAAAVEVIR